MLQGSYTEYVGEMPNGLSPRFLKIKVVRKWIEKVIDHSNIFSIAKFHDILL